jgi:anti-sigma factor RsiW
MTCTDVEQLITPFVDAELPSPMLLAVARHAAACPACDATVRDLTALCEAVAEAMDAAVDDLDLSGVWSGVAEVIDAQQATTHPKVRPLRALPVWGSMVALAASLLLWIGAPVQDGGPAAVQTAGVAAKAPVTRVAARTRTEVDRLAGKAVALKREPKTGTPIIWVNYAPDAAR